MIFPKIERAEMPKGFELCSCEMDDEQQIQHYCGDDIAKERSSRAMWARKLAEHLASLNPMDTIHGLNARKLNQAIRELNKVAKEDKK